MKTFIISVCCFCFVPANAFAAEHLFYKEVNLIGGHSRQNEWGAGCCAIPSGSKITENFQVITEIS